MMPKDTTTLNTFGVQAEFEPNPAEGTMDVTLSTIDNAPVHYTLDGTEPTTASPLFTKEC